MAGIDEKEEYLEQSHSAQQHQTFDRRDESARPSMVNKYDFQSFYTPSAQSKRVISMNNSQ